MIILGKRAITASFIIIFCSVAATGLLSLYTDNTTSVQISQNDLSSSGALFKEANKIGLKVEGMVRRAKEYDRQISEKIKQRNALNKEIQNTNYELKTITKKYDKATKELTDINYDSNLQYENWQIVSLKKQKEIAKIEQLKSEKTKIINARIEQSKNLQKEIDLLTGEVMTLNVSIEKGFQEWKQVEEAAKASLNAVETAAGENE